MDETERQIKLQALDDIEDIVNTLSEMGKNIQTDEDIDAIKAKAVELIPLSEKLVS